MENLSPKEIYDQKRQEKFAFEVRKEKIKMSKKILIFLVALILIFGGIYWLVEKNRKSVVERKIYAVQIADQGRNHIAIGESHPAYNSNPPTSGWHYEEWETKGVYKVQQPDEGLVHNLEHGYIWISYRPDASSKVVEQLNEFYGFGEKIIIEPRKENDKMIALAAWGRLDKFDPISQEALDDVEKKRIQDFIDAYINRGPEPNAP